MTTNMITAARLIAHESKNGRYLSKMAMDKFPVVSRTPNHDINLSTASDHDFSLVTK